MTINLKFFLGGYNNLHEGLHPRKLLSWRFPSTPMEMLITLAVSNNTQGNMNYLGGFE
jgi:hypothetical protein